MAKKNDLQVDNYFKSNFKQALSDVDKQFKHLAKYKTTGSAYVLRKNIEVLLLWLDELK